MQIMDGVANGRCRRSSLDGTVRIVGESLSGPNHLRAMARRDRIAVLRP
jgi:hypothetical protein